MALISNPDNPVSPQGVLTLASIFTFILWVLAATRFWVLRHYTYRTLSPRWFSDCSIWLIIGFTSTSLGLLFYAYHLVLQLRRVENQLNYLDSTYYPNDQSQKLKRGNMDSGVKNGTSNPSVDKLYEKLIEAQADIILKTMKCSLAWRLLCITSLWLVKFSIVMVYVELMSNFSKALRWMIYLSLSFIGSTYIAVVCIFSYGMPSENWGETKQSPLPIIAEYLYGGTNIFTDLQVLIVALWALYVVRLPQSRVYAVSFLLFMGFITISLAIARAIMYDEHIRTGAPLNQSVDIIGMIEPLVASWLACLPALRVLFKLRRKSRNEEQGVISLQISASCPQDGAIQIPSQISSASCDGSTDIGFGRFESLGKHTIGVAIDRSQNQGPIPKILSQHTASLVTRQESWPLPDQLPYLQPERRAIPATPRQSYSEVVDVVDAYGEAYTSDEDGEEQTWTNRINQLGVKAGDQKIELKVKEIKKKTQKKGQPESATFTEKPR